MPWRASQHDCRDVSLRLLALEIAVGGDETYHVSFRPTPGATFRSGRMRHAEGESWDLVDVRSGSSIRLVFGSPDEVFNRALERNDAPGACAEEVTRAAPHWPTSRTERLAHRRLSGAGSIAFDARWFLSELASSAIDRPLLFPHATAKLGLAGLEQASAILRELASVVAAHGDAPRDGLAQLLLRASSADPASDDALGWDGEGRLLGEHSSGELAQLGTDVRDGCQAAVGTGLLAVTFEPTEPLGVGLGPLRRLETASGGDESEGSVGMGAEVGEVDPGGAAERAAVRAGMVLARLSEPDLELTCNGQPTIAFEAVLEAIDERRLSGRAITVTFDTAIPLRHLYAVEVPADAALPALAAATGLSRASGRADVDAGAALDALCGGALVWREDGARLFVGQASSLSCAHTDICPQLEIAHGLLGSKFLAVASHDATPRLITEHAGDEDLADEDLADEDLADEDLADEEATRVPTDRPLTARQSRLLCDQDLTLALLQEGDLAVFDSGALHFASNGADGLNAALYHGAITRAAVPRLRLAAAKATGSSSDAHGAYRNHLFAADLLVLVESLLAEAKPEGP
jgi:hypothetical protein